ncbi:hypothetical protein KX816_16200 [Sphingosinicellaceae bacterium]|nr:hypothetical protein KX816_16200 [Sphingosinicellaceae bacterium]
MSDVAASPVPTAASPDPAAPRSSGGVSLKQLLLVPAIIVPLISAVPVWFDKGMAFYKDIKSGSAAEAEEQIKVASRNITCLNAPYRYYQSATSKLSIDGTICKTGDVLVRVFDEQNEGAIYWVPAELLRDRIDYSRSRIRAVTPAVTPASATMWSSQGRVSPYLRPAVATDGWPARANPYWQLTQMQNGGSVTVLCSQKIDDRHIRQRIRRPDGCFDQVLDLANGAVVSLTPAPCTS